MTDTAILASGCGLVRGQRFNGAVTYESFIAGKSRAPTFGSAPAGNINPSLFPHQHDLVMWALRKGRCAIFADTGLGKTLMQMEWAHHVCAEGRVLVLAPLAVAEQTIAEARRFGIEAAYRRADHGDRITVTNYEMLPHFDPGAFVGIVLDESSILKSFTGATRNALIEAFAATPYRLACTATPAPNDFTELGNHSEFLGVKSRQEMLAEYFVHDGGSTQDWRIKGHAVGAFWRWVASWGALLRTPADIGHDDDGYSLPLLRMHDHVVRVDHRAAWNAGMLFAPQAASLADQRAIRRATVDDRVAIASQLAAGPTPCIVWCELNAEADAITAAIPGAVQIAGSDDHDDKATRLNAFSTGSIRCLVTKPSIAGFGMNWQHCSRMIFAGASHSYEQTYQAIRRCWRFGQRDHVDVHIIRSESEDAIVQNYRRKEADAARLAAEMVALVKDTMMAELGTTGREWNPYNPTTPIRVPSWIGQEAP